jgi:hypothetical protein
MSCFDIRRACVGGLVNDGSGRSSAAVDAALDVVEFELGVEGAPASEFCTRRALSHQCSIMPVSPRNKMETHGRLCTRRQTLQLRKQHDYTLDRSEMWTLRTNMHRLNNSTLNARWQGTSGRLEGLTPVQLHCLLTQA